MTTRRQMLLLLPVVVLMVVLLALPRTGWIGRHQLAISVGIPSASGASPNPLDERLRTGLAARPDDAASQVILATLGSGSRPGRGVDDTVRRLEDLAVRLDKSPAIRAHVLRYSTGRAIAIRRPDEEARSAKTAPPGGSRRVENTPAPDPGDVARYLATAAASGRLGRGNAYFPMMASVGLFAAHRDDEALQALHRAAAKSAWDDYLANDLEARVQIADEVYGPRGAVAQVAQVAAGYFAHFSQMGSAARVAVYLAAQREQAGQFGEGLRIRHDLMRVSATLRSESRSAIGSLVGCALTEIAARRPAGAETLVQGPSVEGASTADPNEAAYISYLALRNRPDEGNWARAQFDAVREARSIVRSGLDRSAVSGPPAIVLAALWGIGTFLAAYVVWLAGMSIAAFADWRLHAGKWEAGWTAAAGIGLMAWMWLHLASVESSLLGPLVSSPQTMAVGRNPIPSAWETARPAAILAAAAIPLLAALVAAIVGALRRGQESPSPPPRLIPIVAIAVAAYAVAIVLTVRQEAVVSDGIHRTLTHEGRYMAALAGRTWPPADPNSGSPK